MAHERGYDEIVSIIEEEENRKAKPAHESTIAPAMDLDNEERTAVANGDLRWLRSRLAEGKLANHVRWSDGGLLTIAVRNNRPEVLRFLLDNAGLIRTSVPLEVGRLDSILTRPSVVERRRHGI